MATTPPIPPASATTLNANHGPGMAGGKTALGGAGQTLQVNLQSLFVQASVARLTLTAGAVNIHAPQAPSAAQQPLDVIPVPDQARPQQSQQGPPQQSQHGQNIWSTVLPRSLQQFTGQLAGAFRPLITSLANLNRVIPIGALAGQAAGGVLRGAGAVLRNAPGMRTVGGSLHYAAMRTPARGFVRRYFGQKRSGARRAALGRKLGRQVVGGARYGSGLGGMGARGAGAALAGGGGAVGAGGAAGAGAALASNPVGWAVAAVVAVGAVTVAFAALPHVIKDFTSQLLEANRPLAEFSASMAAVMATADVRKQMRDMEVGERVAGSAMHLADAQAALAQDTMELEVAFLRLKNEIGALLAKFGQAMLRLNLVNVASPAGFAFNMARRALGMDEVNFNLLNIAQAANAILNRMVDDGPVDAEMAQDWMQRIREDVRLRRAFNDDRMRQAQGR